MKNYTNAPKSEYHIINTLINNGRPGLYFSLHRKAFLEFIKIDYLFKSIFSEKLLGWDENR